MAFARRSALLAGAASLCMVEAANPHADMGGYKPASNVIEHSQMVHDIKDLGDALGDDQASLDASKAIYTNGRYSCKSTTKARTFQGFVSQDTFTKKLDGTAYMDGFTANLSLAGNFWDKFMTDAYAGTGDFDGLSLPVRKMGIKKGILGVLTMYANYELESAISKATANKTGDGDGAPHAWDEGWAFYYGSYGDGKYSAWEFAKKRDGDFALDSNSQPVTGAVKVKEEILKHYLKGLKASRDGDVAVMTEERDNIYRLLALTSIRAALKYSQKATLPAYDQEMQMEGYAYFLAAAGWIAQANSGAAQVVLDLLHPSKKESDLDATLYCQVASALIPAYSALGLSCEMVGVWKDHKSAADANCTLPACPTNVANLPSGLATYVPDVTTDAGSNVDCGTALPGSGGDGDGSTDASAAIGTHLGGVFHVAALAALTYCAS